MIDRDILEAIEKGKGKDPWNPRWTVVDTLGGGWAVEVEVGELLHSLVRAFKPGIIVETGTHKGFSALMMSKALEQNGSGHLYTIDMVDHGAVENFKKFKAMDYLTFIMANSVDAMKAMPRSRKIDFLWLDADHTEEAVLAELDAAMPLLKPGSYVGFHDVTIDPRENSAVQKIREWNPSWEYIRISSARGVDLMRCGKILPRKTNENHC